MPIGRRETVNNAFGTAINNPLNAGDTTLNSVELALLPEILLNNQHAVITLDPLRQNGEPEIVIVQAHGAGLQSVTISRGAYGTVARAHPAGTIWTHAPLTEDLVKVVTSSSRPTDPYEGQLIYEVDTTALRCRVGGSWVGVPPTGSVIDFAGSSAPAGWLFADGSEISRTTFSELFAVISTVYGPGNGSTTFNLPDLRGRVSVGLHAGQSEFDSLGETGGTKDAVVVSHTHVQNSHGHTQSSHSHTVNSHAHGTSSSSGSVHTHGFTTAAATHSHSTAGGDFGNRIATSAGFETAGTLLTNGQATDVTSGHSHGLSAATNTRINFDDIDPNAGSHSHGGTTGNGSANHTHTMNAESPGTNSATPTVNSSTATNQSAGVSGTGANMPPYVVLQKIIKT